MKKKICNICKESFDSTEYRHHLTKHQIIPVQKIKNKKLSIDTVFYIKYYKKYPYKEIFCDICKNVKMNINKLTRHYINAHDIDIDEEIKNRINNMNLQERRKYINMHLYPDDKKIIKSIDDIPGMVVSGGGCGVGKKKKY